MIVRPQNTFNLERVELLRGPSSVLNVENLTDTAYASWSDVFYLGETDPSFIYSNTLMLGVPRTFSVMLQTRF